MTVFDDLAAEQERLEGILGGLDEARWLSPSGAAGWTVADVVRARRAALDALAAADPDRPLAWVGAPVKPATLATTRLAGHWAHGLDMTGPLGLEFPDAERLRHVAWLAHRTLPYAMTLAGEQPVPAIWWTIFDDPGRPDPFRDATAALLGDADPGGQRRRSAFQLDTAQRRRDLERLGGFRDVRSQLIRSVVRFASAQVRAFYGSLIEVRRRPPAEQRRVLDSIQAITERDFGGDITRPFVTALAAGNVGPGACCPSLRSLPRDREQFRPRGAACRGG
jgi:hypothetical protein